MAGFFKALRVPVGSHPPHIVRKLLYPITSNRVRQPNTCQIYTLTAAGSTNAGATLTERPDSATTAGITGAGVSASQAAVNDCNKSAKTVHHHLL